MYTALALKPGINVEQTPLLNSAGWSYGTGIRFFQGMPQKNGGWTSLNSTSPFMGVCRGLHGWADLNATPWISIGTNTSLEVYSGGAVYDITPERAITNPALDITTTSGSNIVTIRDDGNGAIAGDVVVFVVPIAVGGIIIYGQYDIKTIVDDNHYTIEASTPALYTYPPGAPSYPLVSLDSTGTLLNLCDYTTLPVTEANLIVAQSNPLTYIDTGTQIIYLPVYNILPLTDENATAVASNPFVYIDTAAGLIYAPTYTTIPLPQTETVPVFSTTSGGTDVTVFLPNNGLSAGSFWNVDVSTTVGGITLSGPYQIESITDANKFVIRPGSAASSTDQVAENSGNARIMYLIHAGPVSAYYSSGGGYGSGNYGSGPYGQVSSILTLTRPRQWFLDHIGQDLIGNYNGSPLYVWSPSDGVSVRALELNATNFPGATSPPTKVNVSFIAGQQQMVICLGCDDAAGNYDPNLVRWSDLSDFTQWYPTTTNQAGSKRIASGSRLVGGVNAPNFIVFWTDVDMWVMTYIGGSDAQFVWGFNKIADGVDLISPRSIAVLQNSVYWPSYNGFYAYDGGSIRPIVCPVWDKFWANIDKTQIDKVHAQANATFNEISWAFPSASGNGEVDQRITMSLGDGGDIEWTYEENPAWVRTAWINNNVYGPPIGASLNGYLLQHETSNDANGVALPASARSGWFAAQEGSLLTFMERLSHDLVVRGGSQKVWIKVYAQDYPTGPERVYGPFNWVYGSGPPECVVRARGRFFSVEVGSDDLGVFWRLGRVRYTAALAGRRP